MKIKTTKRAKHYVKALAYGPAGVGKTVLCSTAPKPFIISAEGGLLSLPDGIDYKAIDSISDVYECLDYVQTKKARKKYETICLDSITDIAEVLLAELKPQFKNLMQAYGSMADEMMELIRAFRDLEGYHVYMTAKMKRITDDSGSSFNVPSMPGQQLVTNLPYMFDEVMCLHIFEDEDEDDSYRYLQCQPDYHYEAKDRSGQLGPKEKPDLKYLFNKIQGKKG